MLTAVEEDICKERSCSFTYVSWVPKKKMGYLFAGGFTAPSGSSSICETEMEKGLFPNVVSLVQESLPSHGSVSAGIPQAWGGEGKTAADFWGRQVVQSQIQQKHYRETTGDQGADKKF